MVIKNMPSNIKHSIHLPENVEAQTNGKEVKVKGAKGELTLKIHPDVQVEIAHDVISVKRAREDAPKALLGLTKSLLANMAEGVARGYSKKLELEGVGYRVSLSGNKLVMQLGFSHPVEFEAPKNISLLVEKNTITVSGIDKALVGQTAANIRSLKKPEPYKGKGIRYSGEIIRRKEGKRAGTV
jgi:large subunit ribosomal protein L6